MNTRINTRKGRIVLALGLALAVIGVATSCIQTPANPADVHVGGTAVGPMSGGVSEFYLDAVTTVALRDFKIRCAQQYPAEEQVLLALVCTVDAYQHFQLPDPPGGASFRNTLWALAVKTPRPDGTTNPNLPAFLACVGKIPLGDPTLRIAYVDGVVTDGCSVMVPE